VAQLVDAETGNHIWAERAEARRAEKTPNPDSVDLYFQGLANLNRGFSVDLLTTMRWP
jgi:hypothetical protein